MLLRVDCPYCGEPFDTMLDVYHGDQDYIGRQLGDLNWWIVSLGWPVSGHEGRRCVRGAPLRAA